MCREGSLFRSQDPKGLIWGSPQVHLSLGASGLEKSVPEQRRWRVEKGLLGRWKVSDWGRLWLEMAHSISPSKPIKAKALPRSLPTPCLTASLRGPLPLVESGGLFGDLRSWKLHFMGRIMGLLVRNSTWHSGLRHHLSPPGTQQVGMGGCL